MGKRVSDTTSLAIGAQVNNALDGKLFELAPDDAVVTLLAVTSGGDVRATLLIGTDIILDDAQLQVGSALKASDDVIGQHGAFKGEKLTLRLRQVGGAGVVSVVWAVDFEPVVV